MKRPPLTDYNTFPFEWVTPVELAAKVKCDRRSILRMIDNDAIYAYRIGRNWRIPLDEARRVFPVEQTRRRTA